MLAIYSENIFWNKIYLKKLQFWTILLPCNKCVSQKRTYVNKGCTLLNPYVLMVLLSIPFDKLLLPKCRNFGTQTEKTEDKSNATPNTPKISFFRSKNLFAKKQKKRVKYLKKGPLCRENDQKCMTLIFFGVMIIT